MMQAAQLAAEAAMLEATAREEAERNANRGRGEQEQQMPNLSMMDMMQESSSFMTDSSEQMMGQMGLMQALQTDVDGRYQQQEQQYQHQHQQEQYHQQQQQHHHYQQQHQHQRQAQAQAQYGGGGDNNQVLLQEMQMMGIDANDPESVQMFLQILQQRGEQERLQAEANARPEEHYMTIAQNGRSFIVTKIIIN